MGLLSELMEMAKSSRREGTFLAIPKKTVKGILKAYNEGVDDFEDNDGRAFTFDEKIQHTKLKKGMVVISSYKKYDVALYEILGFTDQAGNDKVVYDSVEDMLHKYGVSSLKALEEKQNNKIKFYIVVKDLDDIDEGIFFYLYDGKWVIGSSADPATFNLVEEQVKESLAKLDEAKKDSEFWASEAGKALQYFSKIFGKYETKAVEKAKLQYYDRAESKITRGEIEDQIVKFSNIRESYGKLSFYDASLRLNFANNSNNSSLSLRFKVGTPLRDMLDQVDDELSCSGARSSDELIKEFKKQIKDLLKDQEIDIKDDQKTVKEFNKVLEI